MTHHFACERLVVLSDLHLAVEQEYSNFAGRDVLHSFLETHAARSGTLLLFNGDVFDLLTVDDPVGDKVDADVIAGRMRTLLDGEDGPAFIAGVKTALDAGAQVVITPGNHDLELCNKELHAVIHEKIPGIVFCTEETVTVKVGKLRVAVAHGDAHDPVNRFERAPLRHQLDARHYPPGSRIVNAIVNPAKRAGMTFIDRMIPEMMGAMMTALHLDRAPFRVYAAEQDKIIKEMTPLMARGAPQKFGRWVASWYRDPYQPPGLFEVPDAFFSEIFGAVGSWSSGGWFQRWWLTDVGVEDLHPSEAEWQSADAAFRDEADVVIFGHTHQPRLGMRNGRVLANPGSWTWRLAPPERSGGAAWQAFLDELRDRYKKRENGGMKVDDLSIRQLAAVVVEPHADPSGVPCDGRVRLVRATPCEKQRNEQRNEQQNEQRNEQRNEPRDEPRDVRVIPTDRPSGKPLYADAMLQPTLETDAALAPRLARVRALGEDLAAGNDLTPEDQLVPTLHRQLIGELVRRAAADDESDLRDRLLRAERLWRFYEQSRADRASAVRAEAVVWLDAIVDEAWRASADLRPTATPSPFLWTEPHGSPLIWRRTSDVPLVRGLGPDLTLRDLPFPFVAFPTDWLDLPERYPSLLHEVGHALDHELRLSADRAEAVRRWSARGSTWASWLPEIIADAVMIALGGPGAASALDRLLAAELGHPGLRPLGRPHPPAAIRVALGVALARALHRVEVAVTAERQRELDGIEAEWVDDAAALAAGLCGQGGPAIAAPALVELAGRALPRCRATAEPEPAAALRQLQPTADGVDFDVVRFVQRWRPSLAVPRGIDPDTLFKVPPLPLAVQYDRLAFVGETHGQLAAMLQEARRLRERRWTHVEVFFLNRTCVRRMGTDERPFKTRWAERQAAVRALKGALDRLAHRWAIYEHDDPSLFASFWGPADPGAAGMDIPWARVHTSARVWGRELRNAPSTDWVWVNGGSNAQLRELAAGLDALRADADCLAQRAEED